MSPGISVICLLVYLLVQHNSSETIVLFKRNFSATFVPRLFRPYLTNIVQVADRLHILLTLRMVPDVCQNVNVWQSTVSATL